jgi:hypothetical protein
MTRLAGGRACAALQCRIEDDYDNHLGLLLRPLDIHSFGRQPELVPTSRNLSLIGTGVEIQQVQETLCIKSEKFLVPSSFDGNIVIQALPLVNSGYILSRVHCQPPARYDERNRILNPSGTIGGALAAFIFSKDEKPIFTIVLRRVSRNDDTIADCILLQEENSDEDEDGMTESELLDFMARGYEPSTFGVETFRRHFFIRGQLSTLNVSNTREKSDWRIGADAGFFCIEIK